MSHVPRVYLPQRLAHGPVTIGGDAGRHLAAALRVRPGDPLLLFAGDGREWAATVSEVTKGSVLAGVGEIARQEAPPAVVIETWCALVRANRFEWAIEKCVEAGADIIRPAITAFTQRGDTPSASRLERWRRIVIEAVEQSGRLFVPVIEAPATLERLLAGHRGAIVVADREGRRPADLGTLLPQAGHLALVVGPEGGFAPGESADLARHGAIPATFGPYILRTETAAITGTALLRSLTSGVVSSG